MEGYRRELKYIVSDMVLTDVRNRISGIMNIDPHQKGDFYKIRSLYLDSPDNECLRQNEAGISTREKYRIRAYDCEDGKISAEIKIRHRETISKMSVDISRETFDLIAQNKNYEACENLIRDKEILEKTLAETTDEYLKRRYSLKVRALEKYIMRLAGNMYSPAVIVDYDRCAYVYDACNVRITFDRNVAGSREFDRFFEPELLGRAAIEEGKQVLEIKYDEFLPDEIALALSGCKLVRGSCSKYAKCMYVF